MALKLGPVRLNKVAHEMATVELEPSCVTLSLTEPLYEGGATIKVVLYPNEIASGLLVAMKAGWVPQLGFRIKS